MQAKTKVWGDEWWRFDRYQVVGGRIGPAPGARLQRYDPWTKAQPYVELARLGREVRAWYQKEVVEPSVNHLGDLASRLDELSPGQIRSGLGAVGEALAGRSAQPPVETAEALTRWCREFGLLGLFQHQTLLLTLEARSPALLQGLLPDDPDQLLETLTRFVRTGSSWQELSLLRRTPVPPGVDPALLPRHTMGGLIASSAWPLDESHIPPGQSLMRTTGAAKRHLRETWDLKDLADVRARYLPDLKGPGFPRPNSEPFWRAYSESVIELSGRAVALAEALAALATDKPRRRASALDALSDLLAGVTLEAREQEGRFTTRLGSPSLLGSLAAMAYFDLSGGARFGECDRCHNLFATRREDRRYCSLRCQDAEKKDRKRHPGSQETATGV
jgi:hypothetical protein